MSGSFVHRIDSASLFAHGEDQHMLGFITALESEKARIRTDLRGQAVSYRGVKGTIESVGSREIHVREPGATTPKALAITESLLRNLNVPSTSAAAVPPHTPALHTHRKNGISSLPPNTR